MKYTMIRFKGIFIEQQFVEVCYNWVCNWSCPCFDGFDGAERSRYSHQPRGHAFLDDGMCNFVVVLKNFSMLL